MKALGYPWGVPGGSLGGPRGLLEASNKLQTLQKPVKLNADIISALIPQAQTAKNHYKTSHYSMPWAIWAQRVFGRISGLPSVTKISWKT